MLLIYTVKALKYIIEMHLHCLGGKTLKLILKAYFSVFLNCFSNTTYPHTSEVYSLYVLHTVDWW